MDDKDQQNSSQDDSNQASSSEGSADDSSANQASSDKNSTTQNSQSIPPALPAPPTKSKTNWGVIVLSFLLVLLAGGSAAAGFWGWQQINKLQHELQSSVQQRDFEQHSQKIETLHSQLTALQVLPADNKKIHTELGSLGRTIRQDSRRLNSLAVQMAKVTNQDEVDWLLAQLEHYTLLAHKRLTLTHDLPGAIALLDESISIVKEIDEPQALGIMQALESDKTTLATVADVNLEYVFIQIDEVIKQIDHLAMPQVDWRTHKASDDGVGTTKGIGSQSDSELINFSDIQGWQGYFDLAKKRLSASISSLVLVQTLDKPIKPLLPPEQRVYLQQNLQLMLEQAQLSVMRRQGESFHASVSQARHWVSEYFREDTPTAKYIQKTLTQLLTLEIESPALDISRSIAAVKTFSAQWPDLKQRRQRAMQRTVQRATERANQDSKTIDPESIKRPESQPLKTKANKINETNEINETPGINEIKGAKPA
ncbi:MAG: uroporphyrinogen-III C-methyltransferase [Pseudomonadales bacterium]|nr:uroporphyrinogen-III C-methyltransferase [Pseudomonadales bacterium]